MSDDLMKVGDLNGESAASLKVNIETGQFFANEAFYIDMLKGVRGHIIDTANEVGNSGLSYFAGKVMSDRVIAHFSKTICDSICYKADSEFYQMAMTNTFNPSAIFTTLSHVAIKAQAAFIEGKSVASYEMLTNDMAAKFKKDVDSFIHALIKCSESLEIKSTLAANNIQFLGNETIH